MTEQYTQVVLKAITPPGGIVIDVGANYGLTSFTFAKAVGSNGTVYAVEANPAVFELLKLNIMLNSYTGIVKPYNYAVINGEDRNVSFAIN